ncbi:MAG: hypothetical protein H7125_06700 [Proteobacteria bacterium]|nr:hypothetical protein [Burkholderiales bacterium]
MPDTHSTPTDRFGNPLDPIVRYARGSILQGTPEEVRRMIRARHIVGERVRRLGKDSVFDLSGMNRGSGVELDDVPHLTSHVPFFERFEGHTEPLALRHMGADPAIHSALILNRVSASSFITLTTLLGAGDDVFALVPAGGVTHPSAARPIAMAGAVLTEFYSLESLAQAWQTKGAPRLLIVTPITASKKHLPYDQFQGALALPRATHTLAYVDDAHMASRIAYFQEPRTFEVGDIDIAVCSADKHVAGPRAGVFVGRKDLVEQIGARAYELGLEAQAGQYVGVANALRNFDPAVVREAGLLAESLVGLLESEYGQGRAYMGGPGVSIAGDDVVSIALERRGGGLAPSLVAVEAAGIVAMEMLRQDGVLTIGAVSMPGSSPAVRLMMYPDGKRLGLERIAAALDHGIDRLSQVIDDRDSARALLLGE